MRKRLRIIKKRKERKKLGERGRPKERDRFVNGKINFCIQNKSCALAEYLKSIPCTHKKRLHTNDVNRNAIKYTKNSCNSLRCQVIEIHSFYLKHVEMGEEREEEE